MTDKGVVLGAVKNFQSPRRAPGQDYERVVIENETKVDVWADDVVVAQGKER